MVVGENNSAWKQQKARAIFRPVPNIKTMSRVQAYFGLGFLIFGVILILVNTRTPQAFIRYDNLCDIDTTCKITLKVDTDMKAPVFVYYELTEVFQNHRRYVPSRSSNQLESSTDMNSFGLCFPLEKTTNKTDNMEYILYPCGLTAYNFFTDVFTLPFDVKRAGISWNTDRSKKFKSRDRTSSEIGYVFEDDESLTKLVDDVENEDFIVWMRLSAVSHFRKLYGRIDTDIPKGSYDLEIYNVWDSAPFNGQKILVISTSSWIGGPNWFLSLLFIFCSLICFLLSSIFAFLKKKELYCYCQMFTY